MNNFKANLVHVTIVVKIAAYVQCQKVKDHNQSTTPATQISWKISLMSHQYQNFIVNTMLLDSPNFANLNMNQYKQTKSTSSTVNKVWTKDLIDS